MTRLPVPLVATATKVPLPYVTPYQLLSAAEVRIVQVMPGPDAFVGVGSCVGVVVGAVVGACVGSYVGVVVGAVVGSCVGSCVGVVVGAVVGACVGSCVGVVVGAVVGTLVAATTTAKASKSESRIRVHADKSHHHEE